MPQTRSKRTPDGMGVFLTMDDAKTAAHSAGRDVIDLSVGTSDLAPPPEALAELEASVRDPSTHSYCLKRATMPLLCAAVDWFASTYPDAAQRLDPSRNALSLLGSQEGLAHLLMAVADEGDGIILPDVAYPSYWGAVRVAGLLPTFIPLDSSTLLPDLDALSPSAAKGCKLLLLNLPNNPTGAVADVDYWRAVLAFAERHDLLLIHDNPYVGQVYSEQPPPSPLALPGGLERTVELFSLSKSYQLGGFRCGFALGNANAIASLEAFKAPIDFNQYLGIQRMAVTCLKLPAQRVREYAAVWAARARAVVAVLRRCGWTPPEPQACMYVWTRLPAGLSCGDDDVAFCRTLVAETGVALTPGRAFGPGGVGHVRFALVQPEPVLVKAAEVVCAFAHNMGGCRLPELLQHSDGGKGGVAA